MADLIINSLSLLSGVFLGGYLNHYLHRKHEISAIKREVLREAMAYRGSYADGRFPAAMNQILVVFADDQNVIDHFQKYQQSIAREESFSDSDAWLQLTRAMAKSAGLRHQVWDEQQLRTILAPRRTPLNRSIPK